jgi:crossover junction endodeoxyribonuclease RuvC
VKVVGIDPGTAACGYGIVHESEGRLRALGHGVWTTPPRTRIEVRLKTIYDGVAALIEEHEPDAVVLEESWAAVGVACAEYAPARVKQTVCGYGRADKEQVARMVNVLLGSRESMSNHASDALAVALCHVLASPLLRVTA